MKVNIRLYRWQSFSTLKINIISEKIIYHKIIDKKCRSFVWKIYYRIDDVSKSKAS